MFAAFTFTAFNAFQRIFDCGEGPYAVSSLDAAALDSLRPVQ